MEVGRFDRQTLGKSHASVEFGGVVNPEPGGELIQVWQGDILQDRLNENQSMPFPVFGDQTEACLHGLARTMGLKLAPIQFDLALRDLAILTKDRHHQLSAPGTHQTRNAKNLALAKV